MNRNLERPPVVSVFGSAAPQPESDDFAAAHAVGRLLAERGCHVQTGGYSGVMAAASQGAREAGGHVIGVTSNAIEAWRPGTERNRWVAEEVRHETLRERLFHLLENCDGAVVMPGGPGTLTEFSLMWNLMLVEELQPVPVVLVGELWARTLEAFLDPLYVPEANRRFFATAPDPQAAVGVLVERLG